MKVLVTIWAPAGERWLAKNPEDEKPVVADLDRVPVVGDYVQVPYGTATTNVEVLSVMLLDRSAGFAAKVYGWACPVERMVGRATDRARAAWSRAKNEVVPELPPEE